MPRGHGRISARGNLGFVSDVDGGSVKTVPPSGVRPDADVLDFKPPYSYALRPAEGVKTDVLACAGARPRRE